MKKTLSVFAMCLMLSACIGHETNLETAQAERDSNLYQKRSQEGCTFVHDQAAYRECLLNTYYSKHPNTYQTAELVNGQPIAIVNSMTTYERNSIPQVAPLPVAEAQILAYTTSETTTIEGTQTSKTVTPTSSEVTVTEEVVAQVPVVTKTEVVGTVQTDPIVTEPDPSWWNAHQDQGLVQSAQPKCPCADPNDPCPQCYEK